MGIQNREWGTRLPRWLVGAEGRLRSRPLQRKR